MKELILRNWKFILLWVATGVLSLFIFGQLISIDYYTIPYFIGIFTLGITQWLVLRLYWGKYNWWGFATIVGVILSELAPYIPLYDIIELPFSGYTTNSFLFRQAVYFFIKGGMRGMIASFPQWLVLRRHSSNSGRWILAATLGWGLSGVMLAMVTTSSLAFTIGIPYGLVTGIALVWLHDQSPNAGKLKESKTKS